MSTILHHADFVDFVEERFALEVEGVEEALEAELIEAKEMAANSGLEHQRAPFVLQFRLPPGTGLAQGTFNLRHQKLDELVLFLVPVRADENGWYMEACFN